MSEYVPQSSDETDQKKLLVEIVQGLLMAHARLDDMENALRNAVETASLRHLDAFHRELKGVDARFQRTAGDLADTINLLGEVRGKLVHSVESASDQYLEAATRQLQDADAQLQGVDARFQTTAEDIRGASRILVETRDHLVSAVEGASAQHLEAVMRQLQNADEQFRVTALHYDVAAHSLAEARDHLVSAVEGASTQHLEAFTAQLSGVDDHFQATATQLEQTVYSLLRVRDTLVESVEGTAQKQLVAFSQQVDSLQKAIGDVYVEEVLKLHKDIISHRLTEKTRHDQIVTQTQVVRQVLDALNLDQRISLLSDAQAVSKLSMDTEAKRQSANWANLNQFLTSWQRNVQKSHDHIDTRVTEAHAQIGHIITTVDTELRDLVMRRTEAIEQRVKRSDGSIGCLLLLTAVTLCGLGVILYKLFFH